MARTKHTSYVWENGKRRKVVTYPSKKSMTYPSKKLIDDQHTDPVNAEDNDCDWELLEHLDNPDWEERVEQLAGDGGDEANDGQSCTTSDVEEEDALVVAMASEDPRSRKTPAIVQKRRVTGRKPRSVLRRPNFRKFKASNKTDEEVQLKELQSWVEEALQEHLYEETDTGTKVPLPYRKKQAKADLSDIMKFKKGKKKLSDCLNSKDLSQFVAIFTNMRGVSHIGANGDTAKMRETLAIKRKEIMEREKERCDFPVDDNAGDSTLERLAPTSCKVPPELLCLACVWGRRSKAHYFLDHLHTVEILARAFCLTFLQFVGLRWIRARHIDDEGKDIYVAYERCEDCIQEHLKAVMMTEHYDKLPKMPDGSVYNLSTMISHLYLYMTNPDWMLAYNYDRHGWLLKIPSPESYNNKCNMATKAIHCALVTVEFVFMSTKARTEKVGCARRMMVALFGTCKEPATFWGGLFYLVHKYPTQKTAVNCTDVDRYINNPEKALDNLKRNMHMVLPFDVKDELTRSIWNLLQQKKNFVKSLKNVNRDVVKDDEWLIVRYLIARQYCTYAMAAKDQKISADIGSATTASLFLTEESNDTVDAFRRGDVATLSAAGKNDDEEQSVSSNGSLTDTIDNQEFVSDMIKPVNEATAVSQRRQRTITDADIFFEDALLVYAATRNDQATPEEEDLATQGEDEEDLATQGEDEEGLRRSKRPKPTPSNTDQAASLGGESSKTNRTQNNVSKKPPVAKPGPKPASKAASKAALDAAASKGTRAAAADNGLGRSSTPLSNKQNGSGQQNKKNCRGCTPEVFDNGFASVEKGMPGVVPWKAADMGPDASNAVSKSAAANQSSHSEAPFQLLGYSEANHHAGMLSDNEEETTPAGRFLLTAIERVASRSLILDRSAVISYPATSGIESDGAKDMRLMRDNVSKTKNLADQWDYTAISLLSKYPDGVEAAKLGSYKVPRNKDFDDFMRPTDGINAQFGDMQWARLEDLYAFNPSLEVMRRKRTMILRAAPMEAYMAKDLLEDYHLFDTVRPMTDVFMGDIDHCCAFTSSICLEKFVAFRLNESEFKENFHFKCDFQRIFVAVLLSGARRDSLRDGTESLYSYRVDFGVGARAYERKRRGGGGAGPKREIQDGKFFANFEARSGKDERLGLEEDLGKLLDALTLVMDKMRNRDKPHWKQLVFNNTTRYGLYGTYLRTLLHAQHLRAEWVTIQLKCLHRADQTKGHYDQSNCNWEGYNVTGCLGFMMWDSDGNLWSIKFLLNSRKTIGDYLIPGFSTAFEAMSRQIDFIDERYSFYKIWRIDGGRWKAPETFSAFKFRSLYLDKDSPWSDIDVAKDCKLKSEDGSEVSAPSLLVKHFTLVAGVQRDLYLSMLCSAVHGLRQKSSVPDRELLLIVILGSYQSSYLRTYAVLTEEDAPTTHRQYYERMVERFGVFNGGPTVRFSASGCDFKTKYMYGPNHESNVNLVHSEFVKFFEWMNASTFAEDSHLDEDRDVVSMTDLRNKMKELLHTLRSSNTTKTRGERFEISEFRALLITQVCCLLGLYVKPHPILTKFVFIANNTGGVELLNNVGGMILKKRKSTEYVKYVMDTFAVALDVGVADRGNGMDCICCESNNKRREENVVDVFACNQSLFTMDYYGRAFDKKFGEYNWRFLFEEQRALYGQESPVW